MTAPKNIYRAEINDGRGGKKIVRKGDVVELLPVHLRKQEGEDGEYFAQQHVRELLSMLGPGTYIIQAFSEWPCGKVILKLQTSHHAAIGMDANDFMVIQ